MPFFDEAGLLYLACLLYAVVFLLVYLPVTRRYYGMILIFTSLALLVHTFSLALRWQRVGHGPFINLYEILNSNVWSLMLAFLIFMLLAGRHRQTAPYLLPGQVVLLAWLLITPSVDTYLPPTYNTIWLYFHVLSGKLFLGLLVIATGLALYNIRQFIAGGNQKGLTSLDQLGYRILAFAFCFETLMLLFGAIWAQDAWGRYWAWDPLETWAFMTWLGVLFVLHWRTRQPHYGIYAALVTGCYVLAFLTFFGVPFISTAPHQGMI